MFRERARTLQGGLLILDALCIVGSFGIALVLRVYHSSIPFFSNVPAIEWVAEFPVRSDYAILLVVSLVCWTSHLYFSGFYLSDRSERTSAIIGSCARALVLVGLSTTAVTFVLKMNSISRVFFVYYFAVLFLVLLAKQFLSVAAIRRVRTSVMHARHALVVGAGKPASWFAGVLMDAKQTGYDLVGLLLTKKVMSAETLDVPVLGTVEDLDQTLMDYPVDEVFMVGAAADIAEMAPIAQRLIEKGRVVSLITPMEGGAHGVSGRVTEFSGVPMISFGPRSHDSVEIGLKRATDVVVSAIALVALSPLMALVALAIKFLDPGPAIFAQQRLGIGGRPFCLYKFRSMRTDAEAALRADASLYARYVANDYKLPECDDPRISSFGRFLRKSSLDELPQLWNVLRGEMTLVGPRPIVPVEIEKYEPYSELFLSARPGVTGQWQVSGRSDVGYPERAYLDLDYIASRNLFRDLMILLRTVPAVAARRGAH